MIVLSDAVSVLTSGDYFKVGDATGPWTLPQTTYKYAAIAFDFMINIKNILPTLKLSTAAGAVGAWSSNWWGGNLKGLWYNMKQVCVYVCVCVCRVNG